jgi:hypothetical protein
VPGLPFATFGAVATRFYVDRPFPDFDAPETLDTPSLGVVARPVDIVGPSGETEPSEARLNAARGVLLALLICAPFWIGLFWLFL